ncbi:MAG: peptidylprolyl isomerase, partial [Bacteroidota bacterium]
YDRRASHILISVTQDASPEDTLRAWKKVMAIRDRILNGEKFGKVATETSEDPSAKQNNGDLGFFTVFQMVYPFECAAFNTEVGEVSLPVRTRFGYHIIKVTDKRKAQGQVKVAHIMINVPKDYTEEQKAEAEKRINEVYEKLMAGEDFVEMAKQYSEDKGTASKGGELQWFGTGRMVPEFEIAAFALENNGDISKPVRTSFGWHILKRLDKKEIADFEALKNEIKGKLSKDARSGKSKEAVIARLKKEYGFKFNVKALADFYSFVDASLFEGLWTADKAASLKKELFSFAGKTYNQKDFTAYIEANKKKSKPQEIKPAVDELFNNFVDQEIIAYEESRLEEKYPDFRYLMKEYHDGILLFELTDRMVWTKAVKDTTGLLGFYEKNKEKYMWEKRVDAAFLKFKDDKVKKTLEKAINSNVGQEDAIESILSSVNKKDSTAAVLVEHKKYLNGDNMIIDREVFAKGNIPAGFIYLDDIKQYLVINRMLDPQPKSLDEARGLVTADYQTFLEEKWIAELRAKYKVTVDRKVLSTIK